jgi:hypothetical protein
VRCGQPPRHDAFKPHAAGVAKDRRAGLVGVVVQGDAERRALQQLRQPRLALTERAGAPVFTIQLQEVERVQEGVARAGDGEEPRTPRRRRRRIRPPRRRGSASAP